MKKNILLNKKFIKGVNLTELLVSLSILSIISAIAAPSFSKWLGTIAVKNTSESIASGISLARAEAVKLNQPVRFIMGENGSWSILNSSNQTIRLSKGSDTTKVTTFVFPVARTIATFNGLGQLKSVNDDTSLPFSTISVDSSFGRDDIYGNEVRLSSGGSVNLCSLDPNSNNACGD